MNKIITLVTFLLIISIDTFPQCLHYDYTYSPCIIKNNNVLGLLSDVPIISENNAIGGYPLYGNYCISTKIHTETTDNISIYRTKDGYINIYSEKTKVSVYLYNLKGEIIGIYEDSRAHCFDITKRKVPIIMKVYGLNINKTYKIM
ncbi:MAG: hypothetical protein IJE12_11420 [Prevotella sp.]|nr:hypothetical protein [Prevotella sp.]